MELISPLAKHVFILRGPVKAESSEGVSQKCMGSFKSYDEEHTNFI